MAKDEIHTMAEQESIIGVLFTLLIILILGYVFYIVLSAISPPIAILFVVLVAVLVISILLRIFRR